MSSAAAPPNLLIITALIVLRATTMTSMPLWTSPGLDCKLAVEWLRGI